MMQRITRKEDLPAAPGAYALVIRLRRRLRAWPGSGPVLTPGLYLYAGSANGPGGIRARVLRHARRGKPRPKPRPKPRHWHVDRLTGNARVIAVAAIAGGDECALVADVSALPRVSVPAPGFGSSDCRACPAHLVALPAPIGDADLESLWPTAVWWRDPL